MTVSILPIPFCMREAALYELIYEALCQLASCCILAFAYA